jgi:phosphatidylinositol 3-kinase
MIDRDLKPNSDERRQIASVLKLPPNKPLAAEHKALLWRFRYSLTQDKRALTKFLKCVDWGDVSEASQVRTCRRLACMSPAVMY